MAAHDLLDSLLEIGTRHARDAHHWRLEIELARLQDAFGIDVRLRAVANDVLVARAFPLVDEPRTEPPDQRMEPEDRLNGHVNGRRQVVATTHMRELVPQDGFDLPVGQVAADASGPHEHRLQNAEHAGLDPFVDRITLTLPALLGVRRIVFLVTGADKAEAVRRAFRDEISEDAPASLLREGDMPIDVYLDEAASRG